MNYSEAIQFLYSLQMFGANFGLERAYKLAELAGNPQANLRFIHVAGTNGKGSTCAMLESIYRAAGLRVGLFTSPHLVSFRERMQINRQLISEVDVARLVEALNPQGLEFRLQAAGEPAKAGTPNDQDMRPTMFEFVTVMALKYFAEQKCDLAIWETGLGGRLDATNIVTPLASVITNIAFDHQLWLGDTLGKIAAEKAGIIKRGIPVVTAEANPEALSVIERTARSLNAPLTRANTLPSSILHPPSSLPLLGEHQKQNATLALATVAVLQPQIPVTDEQIRSGLADIRWPGRLQLIERGAQKVLLDGAHNEAGISTLCAALKPMLAKSASLTLIIGVLADKDWRAMIKLLAPLPQKIFTVPVGSSRTADATDLADAFRKANQAAEVSACASLRAALEHSAKDRFIVIAGSLYLIGEALALLDPAFVGEADERKLNDWKITPASSATGKRD